MASKVTSVIRTDIYPIIERALSKSGVINKYRKNIEKCFNDRHKELYDIAPFTRIYFNQKDVDDFFDAIGIKEVDIEKELTKTYYWKMNFNPKAAKDPFTVAMMMVIRYFLKKGDDRNAELSSIYLAFSGKFYPSIHAGKFPTVQPSEYRHVMEYVVNEMLTQKFDLKREGSVFKAIRSLCNTWLNTYKKILMGTPDDEDIADIIQQLHGRIKSFMGNIASAYYKAYEEGLYLSYDSDNFSETSYRIADTDSLKAERCVENTMAIVNNNNIDIKICRSASDKNVKIGEIQSIIESIQSDPNNIPVIKELLRIIVFEYFLNSKTKDVTSLEFISYSITPKPNTKNKNIIREKEIIETWLDENSPQYRKRKSREGTKSSYFKSILKYYVLLINKANK